MSLVTDMILQDAAMADEQRLTGIAQRWQAYYGNLPKPLVVKPGKRDDNIRLNFAAVVVNEGVSFLFGNPVDFVIAEDAAAPAGADDPDDEENPAGRPEDDWLEALWDANQKMTLLQDLAINGGVAGHVYVKVVPAKCAENPGDYPQLNAVDPATVTAIWDPHNVKTVLQWKIEWHAVDPATNKPVAFRQLITRADDGQSWEVVDQKSTTEQTAWAETGRAAWPRPWSPVFHCKNLPAPNQFYGVSDLEEDVVEAANALNFSTSNTNRILAYHGHPKTWGKGFQAKEMNIAVDGTTILPTKEAELHNLEMISDLTSADTFYNRLQEAFHAITRVPKIATGQMDNLGQLSGLALKVLYGPLIRKNLLKQRLYGDMLTDLCAKLLEMGGFGTGRKVTIPWKDPLPTDAVADRTAMESDERLGVSRETILTKLGYDASEEKKRKSQEQQDLGDGLLQGFDRGQMGSSGGKAGGNGRPNNTAGA